MRRRNRLPRTYYPHKPMGRPIAYRPLFPKREREILAVIREMNGAMDAAVGLRLGITRERVRQIRKKYLIPRPSKLRQDVTTRLVSIDWSRCNDCVAARIGKTRKHVSSLRSRAKNTRGVKTGKITCDNRCCHDCVRPALKFDVYAAADWSRCNQCVGRLIGKPTATTASIRLRLRQMGHVIPAASMPKEKPCGPGCTRRDRHAVAPAWTRYDWSKCSVCLAAQTGTSVMALRMHRKNARKALGVEAVPLHSASHSWKCGPECVRFGSRTAPIEPPSESRE